MIESIGEWVAIGQVWLGSEGAALRATELLLGVASIQQALELLCLRPAWRDGGVWSWGVIRREFAGFARPARALFDLALSERGFFTLQLARLAAALACIGGMPTPWSVFPAGLLFLGALLTAVRWRGSFNGGSDSMTILIALSLSVARAGDALTGAAWVSRACLAYIAVQSVASYFLAGVAKARVREWWTGQALAAFLRTPGYGVPALVRGAIGERASVARLASWAIILFECTFPALVFGPRLAAVYVGSALVFHLANAYVFGLNRFVFAWLASYPALLYWAWRS